MGGKNIFNLISSVDISQLGSIQSNSDRDLRIGGTTEGSNPFLGLVDDVAIWNRALSNAEILEIYQRMRPKFY